MLFYYKLDLVFCLGAHDGAPYRREVPLLFTFKRFFSSLQMKTLLPIQILTYSKVLFIVRDQTQPKYFPPMQIVGFYEGLQNIRSTLISYQGTRNNTYLTL